MARHIDKKEREREKKKSKTHTRTHTPVHTFNAGALFFLSYNVEQQTFNERISEKRAKANRDCVWHIW